MKNSQRTWRFAPNVLQSLIVAILCIGLASVSAMGARMPASFPLHSSNGGDGQSSLESSSESSQSSSDVRLIARALPGVYAVPSTCSVPIIPSIITEEEIQLRQYQTDFAKYIEEQAELDRQAALTAKRDVLSIEKFRLDCEIMVLHAKQLLEAKDMALPLSEPTVTSQEVAFRKRQFQIAKEIDNDEIIAHEAGVASLNRVWTARRERIDAEILLLQATVQQEAQDRQRDSAINRELTTDDINGAEVE
ncbi:hypothetical protein D0962_01555 [Leptolyngbyaceae cyanobacterium CCMR0082]|uniref:Uncharacterized protein n=1 Tax=Adonisia turfae CCMR0082 TaxID=2304604 RepID=A0A6M0S0J2_9CYAN|nr:hypothetical protein [Adonisia turfae]MDV3349312.1 hypothetical protein [Leptothoe sp. LEGE 181152]NEZ61472.1 hypothetical protein [Adonisia turfae CCMR0082]